MINRLEADHSSLEYFGYFLRAEREYPFATVFAFDRSLEFATTDLMAIANLMAELDPPEHELGATLEERSRASLEWASRMVRSTYFRFALQPVLLIESILRGSDLHTKKESDAVSRFNRSVLDAAAHVPPLRTDFALARNAIFHGSFEVLEDGSATLRDGNSKVVNLSSPECEQLGRSVLQETLKIHISLGAVALWRLVEVASTSYIIAVLAAEIRGSEEPAFVSDTDVLFSKTDERLLAMGLLNDDVV